MGDGSQLPRSRQPDTIVRVMCDSSEQPQVCCSLRASGAVEARVFC
jgi:hypothetical protein